MWDVLRNRGRCRTEQDLMPYSMKVHAVQQMSNTSRCVIAVYLVCVRVPVRPHIRVLYGWCMATHGEAVFGMKGWGGVRTEGRDFRMAVQRYDFCGAWRVGIRGGCVNMLGIDMRK